MFVSQLVGENCLADEVRQMKKSRIESFRRRETPTHTLISNGPHQLRNFITFLAQLAVKNDMSE